jgi:hypothetical protein
MRIAVFSDIHGNSVGLQAVFAQLEAHAPLDAVYALGDFLAIGPGAEDVIELLVEHDARMIRGNWDESFGGSTRTWPGYRSTCGPPCSSTTSGSPGTSRRRPSSSLQVSRSTPS